METILEIVGKLLGAAFVGAVLYLLPKVKLWLQAKTGTEATNGIILTVKAFVEAADQLYKADDPTGEIRNKYVKEQLKQLGLTITDEINAYIEAAVHSLK